jgi:hypothetical protein
LMIRKRFIALNQWIFEPGRRANSHFGKLYSNGMS